MTDKPIEEQGTFAKECELINKLKVYQGGNTKKLRKFVKKIWADQHEFLQRGILTNLLIAKDPMKYLDECVSHAEQYGVLIPQLIEQGHHGMMVHNLTIHPVKIIANERWLREGDRWAMDQEEDIMEEWIATFMEEHGLDRFVGRIILFQAFGFSGHMKLMDISKVK